MKLLSVLNTDKPDFIWLHLDGRQSYAQQPLHRSATGNLSKLLHAQDQGARMIVIEGPAHEVNWNHILRQLIPRGVPTTTVHWCGLNIRRPHDAKSLVHAAHTVCIVNAMSAPREGSSLGNDGPLSSIPCGCGKRIAEKHDQDFGHQFDEFLVWLIGKLGLSTTAIPRIHLDAPKKNIPSLKWREAAARPMLSLDSTVPDPCHPMKKAQGSRGLSRVST